MAGSWTAVLADKAGLVQYRCLLAENANYCKYVNEWVWLRPRVCVL